MGVNIYSDTFWLADRVRLFVHYTISLWSLCKLIWRHWTYEMPVRYILSSVWVRLSIFSQFSIKQYMGLCVFSLPISLVMVERQYTLSYYHQIGSMNYNPLFRARSWNNGIRCMSLYILSNFQAHFSEKHLEQFLWNCHKTSLMTHWFRQWIGAVRQQAITWINVYLDLCHHHMVSPTGSQWAHY